MRNFKMVCSVLILSLMMPAMASAQGFSKLHRPAHNSGIEECQKCPALTALATRRGEEPLTCLDSYQSGDLITGLILVNPLARKGTESSLILIKVKATETLSIISEQQITNQDLFPHGCGRYLMGARLLPGSEKIAMFYAHNAIRIVDVSTKEPTFTLVHDESIPGMASTCEGYIPGWDSSRENITIDAIQHEIKVETIARVAVEQIEILQLTHPGDCTFYETAYDEQCTGPNSDATSTECLDLKEAKDNGIFKIRRMVRPSGTISICY